MHHITRFVISIFISAASLSVYAIEAPTPQPSRPWCGYTEGTPVPTNTINPTHQHFLQKTNALVAALEHCGSRSNSKIYAYLNAGKNECSSLAMKSDLELAQETLREGFLETRVKKCDDAYKSLFNTTAPAV